VPILPVERSSTLVVCLQQILPCELLHIEIVCRITPQVSRASCASVGLQLAVRPHSSDWYATLRFYSSYFADDSRPDPISSKVWGLGRATSLATRLDVLINDLRAFIKHDDVHSLNMRLNYFEKSR
jgi:hypothetical protein